METLTFLQKRCFSVIADPCEFHHVEATPSTAEQMYCRHGEFHWRDGVTIMGLSDGCVLFSHWKKVNKSKWNIWPMMLISQSSWDSLRVAATGVAPGLPEQERDRTAYQQKAWHSYPKTLSPRMRNLWDDVVLARHTNYPERVKTLLTAIAELEHVVEKK